MTPDFLGILLVEFHDESSQRIVFVDAFLQLTTNERQLEVKIVGMAGLEIMQQRGHTNLLVLIEVTIPIYGEVDYRQKCISIHPIHLTRLTNGLIAKAEVDAKRPQSLQHTIVVLNQRYHLIAGFIHLQVFHRYKLIYHDYRVQRYE